MRTRLAILTLAAGFLVLGARAASAEVVETSYAQGFDSATIRDCRVEPTQLVCKIDNRSKGELRDVEIAVRREFRWTNEFHPGEDNPGWSSIIKLPQPIPPGGSQTFTYPGSFVDNRSDGTFSTKVEVLGYAEIFYPGRPSA